MPRDTILSILQLNILNQTRELTPSLDPGFFGRESTSLPQNRLGQALCPAFPKKIRKSHTERSITYPKIMPETNGRVSPWRKPNSFLEQVLDFVNAMPER
jgi:hypothetical protein